MQIKNKVLSLHQQLVITTLKLTIMDKVYCINCGSDMVDSNYNYETANTDYECKECGETFTHKDIPCEDLDYSTNPLSYFEDLTD